MLFDVEVNGRLFHVAIEPRDGTTRYRVQVAGRCYQWEVRWLDETTLSVRDEQTGRVATVGITRADRPGERLIWVRGHSFNAVVNPRRPRAHPQEAAPATGEQRILAPMPGRIVRVLVQPGAEVRSLQPLVVIEAMKMENELRAPRAGRVKAVAVEEGMSVEAGRVLVVVE